MARSAAILILLLAACGKPAAEAPATELRAHRVGTLPSDPGDAAWDAVKPFAAELRPQDLVEPRKLSAGTGPLRVRALTDGTSLVFRLEWADATDDSVRIPARFGDACAVQVPAVPTPDLPAPQMGEKDKPVEIAYWSASDQAAAAGRPDELTAFFPNAKIDHYPFSAAPLEGDAGAREAMALRYSPARAAGNPAAGPVRRAVQDLVAHGPGTLAPAAASTSEGRGRRTKDGWVVLIRRSLPKGPRTHVCFAVWNGSEEDAGSRKRWVPWTPLGLPSEGGP